jgi:type IV secretory pathway VirJ component
VPASPAASSPSVDSPAPSTGSGNCATVASGDGCWQTVSKAASSDVANTVCNDPKYAVVQPGQQICWNAAGAGGSSVAPSADSGASFYNVQAPAAATSSTQSPSQTPPKRTRRRKSKKTKSNASSNTQSTSNAAPYQVASSPASYIATTGSAATSNSQASTTSANNCATVVAGDGCWQTVSKATADTTLANTVCNDPKYTIVQPGQQICW